MLFISCQKLLSFSRASKFCLDLLVMQKNWLDQKDRLISKFMTYIMTWLTNNYIYCPISHEVKATRQRNSVKYQYITRDFPFFKNHAENETRRLVPDLFFLKKSYMGKSKWSVTQFQYVSIALILLYNQNKLQKRVWEQFRHHFFCMGFQEKCFSCHIPLNGQISQPDCLYSLRYRSICVLQFLLTRLYLKKKRAFKVK